MAEAELMWIHPFGDSQTVPCTHLVAQHPGGDTVTVPCVHPPTAQHPSGDSVTTPCVHRVQQHPGGDTVTNPLPPHNTHTVPCTHLVAQHPGGDQKTVPCVHLVKPHPNGDTSTVPCVHRAPQHPGGDTVMSPCAHPLSPKREELGLGLVFFTDDSDIQSIVIEALKKLKALGVKNFGTLPRPLCVLNRDWLDGFARDSSNPFWPHYDPKRHAIQLTKGFPDIKSVAHHELGHAILGHKCVRILGGGAHSMKKVSSPSVAMSEGWAHFVGLAIENAQGASAPRFQGESDWERRDTSVPKDRAIEYNVACVLWDLYDSAQDAGSSTSSGDQTSLSFAELFRVFSPSLATIPDGPVMADVDDYLTRLKQNNQGARTRIDAVRKLNLG
jgi:hypothetical protein